MKNIYIYLPIFVGTEAEEKEISAEPSTYLTKACEYQGTSLGSMWEAGTN